MAPGTNSLRLPGEHFAAALAYLLAGGIGMAIVAPELAAGTFLSTRVAGVTHLFTLGWLTTTIFGALYQLLPVALGAPVRWERLGHVSFACHAPGVALFVAGIITSSTMLHHVGIGLITAGIILVILNVGFTLPTSTARDVTWWAVVAALTALASTLVLGIMLLHNLHTGFLREERIVVLAVHLHIALIGWALVMIVGMGHRLLPMFLLAHRADTKWTGRALALLPAGLPLLAAGLLLHQAVVAWLGAALLEAGVICFLVQARLFYKARIRPRLDVGLRFTRASLLFIALGALLAPAVLAIGGSRQPRLATTYLIVGLLGGIVLFVVGQFYKIVPFLAWISRYRGKVGREKVPSVAELYSARVAEWQLFVMTTSVVAIALGVVLGNALLVRLAALGFTVGVLIFAYQLIGVAGSRVVKAPEIPPIPTGG